MCSAASSTARWLTWKYRNEVAGMTGQAGGLITVRLDVEAEHDAEFNDWYTLEHVPHLTALPGFLRTRRYICRKWNSDAADIRYLAWYETADHTVEAAKDFQYST